MDSLMKEPIAPCNQLARSTQPCIKIKYWLWPGKGRSVTFARWQVTIRDSTLWDPVSVKFVCSFTCIICHSKIVYYTLHYNKPTDQSTAGHLTATRYAWDDLACNINVELGTREAIKEEQWLSSMAQDVIGGHCNQVHADWIIPVNGMRYLPHSNTCVSSVGSINDTYAVWYKEYQVSSITLHLCHSISITNTFQVISIINQILHQAQYFH